MPTIETCFNCFRTRTYDAEIIQRRQYRPGNFKSYANSLDPPPWRESGSCQDGASAWRRNCFAPRSRPVGITLYSLLLSQFETIYNGTPQDTGQDRYNRYGPVPNRYIIHQSTPHVLSVYRDHAMQGEGKKGDFFPHKQLGTGSKGLEVSGFLLLCIIFLFLAIPSCQAWDHQEVDM